MLLSLRNLLLPLVLAVAALVLLPAPGHASPRQYTIFEAPTELLDDGLRDQTLDEIKGFGVDHIRQLVYWTNYAPHANSKRKPKHFNAANPNAYPAGTWDRLDRLMASAAARNVQVQLTLTGPVPKWATSTKKDHLTRPSVKEFANFVTAVGRRYGAQVSMWSIWNEPNQPQFLMPQYRKGKPVSPGIYRALYVAATKALRKQAANKHDKILVGETSPRGNQHIVAPLTFLRGMLCLNGSYHRTHKCGKLDTQGYAHHAYTTRTGPRFVPPANDVTIGVLSRLNTALLKAGRAGVIPKGLKIYLTEFGIQSTPDLISGVSFAKQALYRSIAEHIAYVNSRVAAFSQYLMRDDKPRKTGYRYGGFESGLRRWNGQKKPSYESFRLPLAIEKTGGSDVFWGFVRPLRARTSLIIQVHATGKHAKWRTLRRVTTTPTGVYGFSARHHRNYTYRVRWTSPSGTTYTGPAIPAS
jgi:hypothetical protein